MSVDNDFFQSLLWTASYHLEKDKDKHVKLFEKFRTEMYLAVGDNYNAYVDEYEPDTFNGLASLYRKVFVSSQEEKCFLQNERYQSEFHNQSLLGRGSFGTVFKVTHKLDGQNYAVKKQITNDEDDMNNFLKEIEMISSVKHDHLLDYRSFWLEFDEKQNSKVSYIQMDLCVMTLASAIVIIHQIVAVDDPVQLEGLIKIEHFISCSIFDEILQGVNFLHSCVNPIIHRDLKPSNIMLTDGINSRFVKIADFGLLTFLVLSDQSHTELRGTKEYRAPEVYTRKYDTKADMFSLGRILFELFALEDNLSNESNHQRSEINSAYWAKLFQRLTNSSPKVRPSCRNIIIEREEWFYELDRIRELDIVNKICNQTGNKYEFEKDFKEYFIYQKKDTNKTSLNTSNETKFSMALDNARQCRPEIIEKNERGDEAFADSMVSVALDSIKEDHENYAGLAKHVTNALLRRYLRLFGKRFIVNVGLNQNFDSFYERDSKERKFIKFNVGNILFSIYQT